MEIAKAFNGGSGALQVDRTVSEDVTVSASSAAFTNDMCQGLHGWVFTARSFARLFADLAELGILDFLCQDFQDTEQFQSEFFVSMCQCNDQAEVTESWHRVECQLEAEFQDKKVSVARLRQLEREADRLQSELFKAKIENQRIKNSFVWSLRNPLRLLHGRKRASSGSITYTEWVRRYDTLSRADCKWIKKHAAGLACQPLISVVMPVYNPPAVLLRQAIRSVFDQLYTNWELCIADDASTNPEIQAILRHFASADPRVRVVYRETNGHISAASNSALALAKGEWIALLDHDDALPEHALFCVAQEINDHPEAALIYSDEDKMDDKGRRFDPNFKPDWNPVLLLALNFFSHLGVYRHELIRSVGGFRESFEGSQDHDLILRCSEKVLPDQIRHIPRILYHWRACPGSAAATSDAKPYARNAARQAIREHLQRRGISARVEVHPEHMDLQHVIYDMPKLAPLVSIIIPMRDRLPLIRTCVHTLESFTQYQPYEIIIADNDSCEKETRTWLSEFSSQPHHSIISVPGEFCYGLLNNQAVVRQAQGEVLLFLNNDMEIIRGDWLMEMVSCLMQDGVGIVGARLWFPDTTIQHAGMIVGLWGLAAHHFTRLRHGHPGYIGRAIVRQNLSAVTGACLAIRRSVFEEVGGFVEKELPVEYNDVDLCLRVREAGYQVIWTPHAELIHYESSSRGYEIPPHELARRKREVEYMKRRWKTETFNDPAYNPNLSLVRDDFALADPPRIARPWRK
jgi:GT2 family glycosyltransferase